MQQPQPIPPASETPSAPAVLALLPVVMKRKEFWSGFFLAGIILSVGICTSYDSFANSDMVFWHEIIFMLIYSALYRSFPRFGVVAEKNRFATILLLLWFVSFIVSYVGSPYAVASKWEGTQRLFQTLVHVLFGFYVADYVRKSKNNGAVVFFVIPATTLVVIGVFISAWFGEGIHGLHVSRYWYGRPPLNSNIRHTGYQVTAAIAISLAAVPWLLSRKKMVYWSMFLPVLLLLWAFLFWLGGRSAVLSCVAAWFFMLIVLRDRPKQRSVFSIIVVLTVAAGFFIAEHFSVFPWNGMLYNVGRTVASSDVNEASSGRIDIWLAALSAIKEHPVFGYGPNGYYFMPGRIFIIHPHNVVLQFLMEWGGVGALLFSSFLAAIIYKGYRSLRAGNISDPETGRIMAGSIIVALTVHALLDGTYFHGQPSAYLALAYGFWVAGRKYHEG